MRYARIFVFLFSVCLAVSFFVRFSGVAYAETDIILTFDEKNIVERLLSDATSQAQNFVTESLTSEPLRKITAITIKISFIFIAALREAVAAIFHAIQTEEATIDFLFYA